MTVAADVIEQVRQRIADYSWLEGIGESNTKATITARFSAASGGMSKTSTRYG